MSLVLSSWLSSVNFLSVSLASINLLMSRGLARKGCVEGV